MEGKGNYTWPDGRSYNGDFVGGKKEGNGVMYWPNGEKYEG